MINNKYVEKLLLSTKRKGMSRLISYLHLRGYFESPASIQYHSNYKGGLLVHCNSVYELFTDMLRKFNMGLARESIIICSFLHDLCKLGKYIKVGDGIYQYNPEHPTDHAELSIQIVEQFIKLTKEER